jgi:type IV secretion system protein VirB3
MQNTNSPREIVIHQSANRPNQILGGDRELILLTILIAISLAFSLATWWGTGLSILFWLAAIAVLQRMGKADPMLRQVYLRHREFYPVKSALVLSVFAAADALEMKACEETNIGNIREGWPICFCPTP